MLALIVAVAHNRVIGKDNTLIWHLPNDLKFFKEKTCSFLFKEFQIIRQVPN